MTDEADVADLVARVSDKLGPVDAVVANATGPQSAKSVNELTWQDHLDQLLFFVKSPTLLLRAALPGMKSCGRGRFIHIGSEVFEQPARQVRLRRG